MLEEDLRSSLRLEFVDSCDDRLTEMEHTLERAAQGNLPDADALRAIRRAAHSIKGTSASLGFPFVSTLAHRLEDFLDGETKIATGTRRAISQYMDAIRSQVERPDRVPSQDERNSIVRGLPSKLTLQDLSIELRNIEALLVIPASVTAKIVRTELAACGYKSIRTALAMEGLMLGLRSEPDFIIVSQTLDELSGSDLVRAFRAISSTADIPCAILTSFARDNPIFKAVPEGTSIIRTGNAHFSQDMGDFLAKIDTLLG